MRRFLPLASYIVMWSVLLGTLFKLMHWPGADEMIISGLGTVIFLIPFYFIVRIKDTPSFFGKFAYFSLIFSSCVSVLGVLFKIMHWPGADEMCILGISSLIFPSLLFYAIFQAKKANNNFKESYYGFFGILLFCLLVVSFAYRPASDVVNTLDYFRVVLDKQNISKLGNDIDKELIYNNIELQQDLDNIVNSIEDIKLEILKECKMEVNPDGNLNYKKDNLDVSTRILVRQRKGNELFQKLETVNQQLSIHGGFSLSILNKWKNGADWTYKNFGNMPASGALAKLTCIQTELLQFKKRN